MTLTFVVLCYLSCATDKRDVNHSALNAVTDPIGLIQQFLSNEDQQTSRLASRTFNHHYNKSHFHTRKCIETLEAHAERVICHGIIDQHIIRELERIHNSIRFNNAYLRKWPQNIAKLLDGKQALFFNRTWYDSWFQFRNALCIYKLNRSKASPRKSESPECRLLISASQNIFTHMFPSPCHFDDRLFDLFVFDAT